MVRWDRSHFLTTQRNHLKNLVKFEKSDLTKHSKYERTKKNQHKLQLQTIVMQHDIKVIMVLNEDLAKQVYKIQSRFPGRFVCIDM